MDGPVRWRLNLDRLASVRDTLLEKGEAPPRARTWGSRMPAAGSRALSALTHRVAPFCEVLYLMMVADGACDVAERGVLIGVARTLSGDQLSAQQIDAMLAEFEAGYLCEGVEARLESVTAWLSADRDDAEAAFTLAAVMAIADEHVDSREDQVLSELAELLGISEQRAADLVAGAGLG